MGFPPVIFQPVSTLGPLGGSFFPLTGLLAVPTARSSKGTILRQSIAIWDVHKIVDCRSPFLLALASSISIESPPGGPNFRQFVLAWRTHMLRSCRSLFLLATISPALPVGLSPGGASFPLTCECEIAKPQVSKGTILRQLTAKKNTHWASSCRTLFPSATVGEISESTRLKGPNFRQSKIYIDSHKISDCRFNFLATTSVMPQHSSPGTLFPSASVRSISIVTAAGGTKNRQSRRAVDTHKIFDCRTIFPLTARSLMFNAPSPKGTSFRQSFIVAVAREAVGCRTLLQDRHREFEYPSFGRGPGSLVLLALSGSVPNVNLPGGSKFRQLVARCVLHRSRSCRTVFPSVKKGQNPPKLKGPTSGAVTGPTMPIPDVHVRRNPFPSGHGSSDIRARSARGSKPSVRP